MRRLVVLLLLSCPVLADPGDQCKPPPPASSSDDLTGSTYTWVKDDGGAAPGAGAVVRMDLYGGHVDLDTTTGAGGPTVATGTYAATNGPATTATVYYDPQSRRARNARRS